MKRTVKTVITIILLAISVLLIDVTISYVLKIIYSFIDKAEGSFFVEMGIVRVYVATIGFHFILAGWAYLLAIVIYHFYRTHEFLKTKFFWVILFLFVFYLLVDFNVRYADFMLTTTIYFAVVIGIYFADKWFKKTSILFLIFMMFFYYYWFEDNFKNDVLIIHTLTYIPLAIIGRILYDRFFPVKEEALKNEG